MKTTRRRVEEYWSHPCGGKTRARARRLPAPPGGNAVCDEPSLMRHALYMRASVGWATGRPHRGGGWRRGRPWLCEDVICMTSTHPRVGMTLLVGIGVKAKVWALARCATCTCVSHPTIIGRDADAEHVSSFSRTHEDRNIKHGPKRCLGCDQIVCRLGGISRAGRSSSVGKNS